MDKKFFTVLTLVVLCTQSIFSMRDTFIKYAPRIASAVGLAASVGIPASFNKRSWKSYVNNDPVVVSALSECTDATKEFCQKELAKLEHISLQDVLIKKMPSIADFSPYAVFEARGAKILVVDDASDKNIHDWIVLENSVKANYPDIFDSVNLSREEYLERQKNLRNVMQTDFFHNEFNIFEAQHAIKHEAGHIVHNHVMKRNIVESLLIGIVNAPALLKLVTNKAFLKPRSIPQVATTIGANLATSVGRMGTLVALNLLYSKSTEREADDYAIAHAASSEELLAGANFYQRDALKVIKQFLAYSNTKIEDTRIIDALHKETTPLTNIFFECLTPTHPSLQSRVEKLTKAAELFNREKP